MLQCARPGQKYGVPPFQPGVIVSKKRSWSHQPNKWESAEAAPLLSRVRALLETTSKEVSGVHLIATFVKRRVQALQARVHPLFEYAGAMDPTRAYAEELSAGELEARVCRNSSRF